MRIFDYIFHEYHAIQWEFKRYDLYLATVLIITITQKQCIWVPCATSLFGLLFAVWNPLRNRFRWKSLDFPFLQHFFFLNSKIELRASSKICSMSIFILMMNKYLPRTAIIYQITNQCRLIVMSLFFLILIYVQRMCFRWIVYHHIFVFGKLHSVDSTSTSSTIACTKTWGTDCCFWGQNKFNNKREEEDCIRWFVSCYNLLQELTQLCSERTT